MPGRLSNLCRFFRNRQLGGLEKLLFLCIFLTCAVLVADELLIKTRLVIEPESGYQVYLSDDRVIGGDSSVKWINAEEFEWHCTLRKQYKYPFCQFQVLLGGVDFSQYQTMKVNLEYRGDKPSEESVRIYLRNDNPVYSQKGVPESLKYNRVEMSASEFNEPVHVQMKDFNVPDWWLREFNIPPENSNPEFDDIIYLEIVTGTDAKPGTYDFKLNSIEWEGNLIPREQWYLSIIIAWLILLFGILVYRLWYMRSALNDYSIRENELKELNNALDLKSRRYEKLAQSDPLTGLNNRAGIRDLLMRELHLHNRNQTPLSLILMDVDHFKRINDTFGHCFGDEVLMNIAHQIRTSLRASDGVARWGGEEFLIVCPNTTLESGRGLAEKLRQRLNALNIGMDINISASFGVAMMGDESIEELITRVDRALYQAKQNGRDRVEVSQATQTKDQPKVS